MRPGALVAAALAAALLGSPGTAAAGASGGSSGPTLPPLLDTEPRPPEVQSVRPRPRPLLELGEPFLATGTLSRGWSLPTGAVWRPQLLVYGTLRTAVQRFETAAASRSEWANRLDLFANLRLSGTERLFLGLRPLNDATSSTGYSFSGDQAPGDEGWTDGMNMDVRALFFEGDFGELFPRADHSDRRALDLGFSIGRQSISFQDGLLVDDVLDVFGITRNSLRPQGASKLRLTGLAAWSNVHRDGGARLEGGRLLGLLTALDLRATTLEFDLLHASGRDGGGNGFVAGIGATQRLGTTSTTFRLLASIPDQGGAAPLGEGQLLYSSLSWTPGVGHDLVYLVSFIAAGRYESAARDAESSGPLGRVGILYTAPGIGSYGAALSSRAEDAAGLSLGWQMQFADGRRQLVLEAGGRTDTDGSDQGAVAFGVRFQQALANRFLVQLDGFVNGHEHGGPDSGVRAEFLVKF